MLVNALNIVKKWNVIVTVVTDCFLRLKCVDKYTRVFFACVMHSVIYNNM